MLNNILNTMIQFNMILFICYKRSGDDQVTSSFYCLYYGIIILFRLNIFCMLVGKSRKLVYHTHLVILLHFG